MSSQVVNPHRFHLNPALAVRVLVIVLPALAWGLLVLLAIDLEVCRVALFRLGGVFGVDAQPLNDLLTPLARPVIVFSNTMHPFLLLWLMWAVMAVAMMLPTASRMLDTYADLVGTAASKAVYAPPVWVLAAGYLTVWIVFALLVTILQVHANGLLGRLPLDHSPWPPALAGLLFLGAGAWQFSPLKEICLTKCQNPFPILFSRWRAEPTAIYRLGLEQGLYCLGCCWAMMSLMFAVGTMNLLWMAVAGLAMGLEKSSKNKLVPTIIFSVLIFVGCATLLVTIMDLLS